MDFHMMNNKEQKLDELVRFIKSNPIVWETYTKCYETDAISTSFFQSYSIEDINLFITNWLRFIKE
jgi:hypothetical protein